jgi:hypothetical protein
MLVGGAYTGEAFAGAMKELVGASVEVVQRHQLHTFAVLILRGCLKSRHTVMMEGKDSEVRAVKWTRRRRDIPAI